MGIRLNWLGTNFPILNKLQVNNFNGQDMRVLCTWQNPYQGHVQRTVPLPEEKLGKSSSSSSSVNDLSAQVKHMPEQEASIKLLRVMGYGQDDRWG